MAGARISGVPVESGAPPPPEQSQGPKALRARHKCIAGRDGSSRGACPQDPSSIEKQVWGVFVARACRARAAAASPERPEVCGLLAQLVQAVERRTARWNPRLLRLSCEGSGRLDPDTHPGLRLSKCTEPGRQLLANTSGSRTC